MPIGIEWMGATGDALSLSLLAVICRVGAVKLNNLYDFSLSNNTEPNADPEG